MNSKSGVLVVDFGAQYAQLIARRVREAHVFSEIIGHNLTAAEIAAKNPVGIIFSGGPASVHVDGAVTRSCSVPLSDIAGKAVTTIEGLKAADGTLHKVQQA